jgi:hypothetical protein
MANIKNQTALQEILIAQRNCDFDHINPDKVELAKKELQNILGLDKVILGEVELSALIDILYRHIFETRNPDL